VKRKGVAALRQRECDPATVPGMGFNARVAKLVRGWRLWWRASALLRPKEPLPVEVRHYDASAKSSEEPTALDDLEAFVRDVYGRQAALRKLRKLNDVDLELVINVDQQDRVVQVRRTGRRWTSITRGG
jgi:hypothetical protein